MVVATDLKRRSDARAPVVPRTRPYYAMVARGWLLIMERECYAVTSKRSGWPATFPP